MVVKFRMSYIVTSLWWQLIKARICAQLTEYASWQYQCKTIWIAEGKISSFSLSWICGFRRGPPPPLWGRWELFPPQTYGNKPSSIGYIFFCFTFDRLQISGSGGNNIFGVIILFLCAHSSSGMDLSSRLVQTALPYMEHHMVFEIRWFRLCLCYIQIIIILYVHSIITTA